MKIEFEGQVVLVTGATRGIGRQIADDLALLGAHLILTGTDPVQIARLNDEAAADLGRPRRYYAVDFAVPDSLEAFLHVLAGEERIDVCINNAGINRLNPVEAILDEDWEAVRAVNLEAPFRITRVVTPIMKRHRYGRIVNIASIWSVISKPGRGAYTVTKFGLRGLTLTSALELAPFDILVNAVSPGFVLTELTTRNLSAEEMAALAEQVPLGRFAQPEEISRVVLFLASRLNTYIAGQNIVVDGGFVNA